MYVCVGRRCIYVCAYVCQESLHDASSNQVRGRQIRISAPVLVQCSARPASLVPRPRPHKEGKGTL